MENKRKVVVGIQSAPEHEMGVPVSPDCETLAEHALPMLGNEAPPTPAAGDEEIVVAQQQGVAIDAGRTPTHSTSTPVADDSEILRPSALPVMKIDAEAASDMETIHPSALPMLAIDERGSQDEAIVMPVVQPMLNMDRRRASNEEILAQINPLPAMSAGVDVPDNPPQRKSFAFNGAWIADDDPMKIGENNFADIQNYRYRDRGIEGVAGYSKINTNWLQSTPGTYYQGRSGIQLATKYTVGSYLLAQAWNAGGTGHAVIVNKTAVPGTGNFESALVHTDGAGAGLGRFSLWPGGNVAYCNGAEAMIWAGAEMPVAAMITSTAAIADAVTRAVDYSDAVRNSLQTPGNVAIIGGENDASTVLLLHCDAAGYSTTIPDTSVGGDGGSAHGNASVTAGATLAPDAHKFGTACLYGDGSGDCIYFADHADWNFGTGDFTIDLWVMTPADAQAAGVLAQQYTDGDNMWLFGISAFPADKSYLSFTMYSSGVGETITGTIDLNDFGVAWHHVAVVRTGNVLNLYVDGVLDASGAFAYTMPGWAQPLEIMGPADVLSCFRGHFDEIRITKGKARWTGSTFTVPAAAYRNSANYFLVGSTRPLQGVKIYLSSVNSKSGATMTVKEWNGAIWSSLSVTDNTTGLKASGTVTWTSTVASSKTKFIEGRLLYWYQFYLDSGSAEIYQVTVDAPFQSVKDIWDGIYRVAASFRWDDSGTEYDKTLDVAAQTPPGVAAADSYTADIGGLDGSDAIYIGFEERMCGIRVALFEGETGKVNSNAATLSVYYWDGNDWSAVSGVVDGTLDSGSTKTLTRTGVLSWTSRDNGQEFQRDMNNLQLYYYKIVPSGALSADVLVDLIQGIPAQRIVDADMVFPFQFQGRAMLAKENYLAYSAAHAPDVWNGEDSSNGSAGEIYVGEADPLTGAIQIYNRFGSSIYNTAILAKKTKTYLLNGSGPDDWSLYTISENIGCPAPLTLATAELGYDMAQEAVRNIVIWLSDSGPVIFDGGILVHIKQGVSCYFDPDDSRCIEMDNIANAVGWVDTLHNEYNLCIPSGDTQYYNNVWLVYDLARKKWFKKYCGSYVYSPQAAVPVQDAYGNRYVYVFDCLGWMLRAENGNTWAGISDIAYSVTTADLLPTGDIWDYTMMRRVKLICDANSEGDSVAITHYANGASSGTSLTAVSSSGSNRYVRNTQAVNLKAWSHQVKFAVSTGATAKGVPLLAWGFTYEVIREDH